MYNEKSEKSGIVSTVGENYKAIRCGCWRRGGREWRENDSNSTESATIVPLSSIVNELW